MPSGTKSRGEPQVRINGFSLNITSVLHLVLIVGLMFSAAGSWYTILGRQDTMIANQNELKEQVIDVKTVIDKNRAERVADIKDLQGKLEGSLIRGAKLEQQIATLNDLVTELRRTIADLKIVQTGKNKYPYGGEQ